MRKILTLILSACLLAGCECKTFCGTVKNKWQEGRFSEEYYISVVDDGGVHVVKCADRNYWGSKSVGDNACGQQCNYE